MLARFLLYIVINYIFCMPTLAHARANLHEYQITLDRYYSPYVGAHLGITARNIYGNLWLHSKKELGITRIVHSLADIFITFNTVLFSHEIYGHGFRLRELGNKHIQYHIGLFHGHTRPSRPLSSAQHKITASLGGVEAADIMARKINMRWLSSQTIGPLDAWQYIFSCMLY